MIKVFAIAWPIILSNLSTPLLGLVDTAVVGNLGDPALIGAIAVGGMIFSFLYWGFGFLRMGTTGLVSQASGAGDALSLRLNLYRPLLVGFAIGGILLVFNGPIGSFAFSLIDGSHAVEEAALVYFGIRILAAPISLAHLAITGYLLGIQQTRTLLAIQILLNGTNILLDFVFVVWLGWGVAGVALATVIAEVIAFTVAGALVIRSLRAQTPSLRVPLDELLEPSALKRMFVVNRDIMIRTLCLIFAFAWFTNQGAKAGDTILAVNAILMQFVTFSAFFLDGFALAAETLVGHAVGEKNRQRLDDAISAATKLGLYTSLGLSVTFAVVALPVIDILTNVVEVRTVSREYLAWAILAPPVSVWCFLLDGIFIGATRSVEMRNAMIFSLAVFLGAWAVLHPEFGNHGLWAALMINYLARALSLYYYLPRLRALGYS
jgi:MATE family multidrug resistance protein